MPEPIRFIGLFFEEDHMSENPSALSVTATEAPRQFDIPALFWGMVVHPRSTLTYLRDAGGLNWLWPATLAVVVLIVSTIAIAPVTRTAIIEEQQATMRKQFGDDISPVEQKRIDQVVNLTSGSLMTIVFPVMTGMTGLVFGWFIRGAILYLVSLLVGGQSKFGAMLRIGVWTAVIPDVVRQVVSTVGTVITGRTLEAGLSFLVNTSGAKIGGQLATGSAGLWQTFLGGIDGYWLWGMVLTVIGVAVAARFSWRKGLVVALCYWLIAVLFTLGSVWVGLGLAAALGVAPR
jgi:hypothetical protein